ncbi:hypothetical protein D1B31_21055 [Neobacillus notoginsengisoli]|uniref:Peptidase M14 domain-containing protein n=1 Tax=Neobacillus notoginsengisoli TaxID=1578198 RepID=A0A417YIR9_9BACI|nr:M14 family zinc carboxypeptidase [Neobacillus notoginsengisoli]RHW32837.1 hypothetical protein D1B31_21055 [Neobacillus notoginsengisoli]
MLKASSKNTKLKVFLTSILIICLAFPTVFATANDSAAEQVPFVKTPGTFPIVEVTVTGSEALEALFADELDLDIFGYDYDGDEFTVTIQIHNDELEYFEANNISYEVVDDGTWIFEKPSSKGSKSAKSVMSASAEGQPIPGLPERANASPTVNSPLPLPITATIEPDAVFDPKGVSFNARWGFPDRLGYRTVTEFYAEMNYLAAKYPELVKLHEYGVSFEGVPLRALEISNNPGGNDGRPATVHQAGNHAREYNTSELAMNLGWHLITKYGEPGHEEVTKLLDTTSVWILPMTNPDGVHWDMRNSPGSWRYNRNNYAGTKHNPDGTIIGGVDLNRNYAYGWGSINGSQSVFGQGNFRGGAPLSEPEIMAVSEVLRSNMVVSSLSGHSFPNGNGQLVVYPWAFVLNTYSYDDTRELPIQITDTVSVKDLGRRQGNYNLYSDEFTNGMYAYSGESLDYKLGALRTLGFLYEFGRTLLPKYTGADQYYAVAPYKDQYFDEPREFLLTYPTAANAAGAGAPSADISAPPVFLNAPYDGGYGRSRFTTVEQVNALGAELNGKILVTTRANANNDNAAIAIAAQNLGAVGVIMVDENAFPHGYGYRHYNPNLGNGTTADVNRPADVRIPVAGTSKPYVRELNERIGSGKLTIKSTTTNQESMVWTFERNIGAFMENMSFAAEFSSHIKGKITDKAGRLVPEATLKLEKEVVSPLIEGNTGLNEEATRDRITQSGEFRQQQTAVYEVKGGVYDWSVTPSKQLDNPLIHGTPIVDEGYTITVSAPGKKSVTKENVKISSYQSKIELDFELQSLPKETEVSAFVTKLKGNQNDLTITVTEHYTDGYVNEITETIRINNNAAGTYEVGDNQVYVDTKGDTQIRECYVVE